MEETPLQRYLMADDDLLAQLVRPDIPFSCSQPCGEICELLLLSSEVTVIFHGYFDDLFIACSLYKILDWQSDHIIVFHVVWYCIFFKYIYILYISWEMRYFSRWWQQLKNVIMITWLKTWSQETYLCKFHLCGISNLYNYKFTFMQMLYFM